MISKVNLSNFQWYRTDSEYGNLYLHPWNPEYLDKRGPFCYYEAEGTRLSRDPSRVVCVHSEMWKQKWLSRKTNM